MKIWIDFINTPQVSFFEPLINELSEQGHEFVITCRDSANTVQLIQQRNWAHTVIGVKSEKSFFKKILAFPWRVYSLFSFLRNIRVDIAICQSSFYLPITAKLLGIPSIYTNDNEHALGNIPSFLFATKIFVPENLALSKVIKQGARREKIVQYPGIKEGIYLWPNGFDIQGKRKNSTTSTRQIFIRPEPSTAEYYSGKLNFLDPVLVALKKEFELTILVRDKIQLQHYTQSQFSGISVPANTIPFESVAINCLLFIGAGGSMTREMALMGIPTISVYQGSLLEVDKLLIEKKLMLFEPEITLEKVKHFIDEHEVSPPDLELLLKGRQAYNLFKSELLSHTRNN